MLIGIHAGNYSANPVTKPNEEFLNAYRKDNERDALLVEFSLHGKNEMVVKPFGEMRLCGKMGCPTNPFLIRRRIFLRCSITSFGHHEKHA